MGVAERKNITEDSAAQHNTAQHSRAQLQHKKTKIKQNKYIVYKLGIKYLFGSKPYINHLTCLSCPICVALQRNKMPFNTDRSSLQIQVEYYWAMTDCIKKHKKQVDEETGVVVKKIGLDIQSTTVIKTKHWPLIRSCDFSSADLV
ncbi:hypothetical protein PHYBLDRAFT_161025 [Phycomyces blakesleeanus NRRL 1555(-)]|uniref:Uncharacterized protein n=1 Tax=Phycomyces blakesleeanus (strain ATCC 8743b / DSM 1359 / FGSC 10004 / NBRC 33097 / NRRL 1555) TaxID=763407 RepID=A0A167QWB0_PHYB8|nr:hypothetical protein PHYBLDRAFT_161025 [Phycomyces blakesleeanus NRRL 1555(-)]OAD80378.1 hypothetical protein PHYBLDRAFT_161025 [Phycomyces blakesleeanus NRRL 1555(-)]|eukprot:XP_018298418.1 hypothetical protein PHYBLDRAFT_161025 [Phycomyces blakesleeanus NRRL 1555(-)]